MRAQLSLEFLVIFGLIVGFLVAVLGLYSQTKQTVLYGIDRLTVSRTVRWASFVAERPAGTEILYEPHIMAGRALNISCGPGLSIAAPFYKAELLVDSSCESASYDSCIRITSTGQGVSIDACD